MQEPSESGTRKAVPPPQHDPKDKGKAKMIEPEKPLKQKDQIKFDEEVAKRLAEELEAKLEEEEERVTIQREEEANLISWDNTQAMMEADYKLAQRLQAEEQGELTIEERSRLFVVLMDKRKKHFAKLRAEKIRRKAPTKAQKWNQIKPALSFMRPFGCPVTILNTIDHLGKFDGKADEGFFIGYSINSKAFRVFNSRTRIVEENLHV
ncbi:ribonuclease H-like domain-containing protein, partial [Tanacetum coccineum]